MSQERVTLIVQKKWLRSADVCRTIGTSSDSRVAPARWNGVHARLWPKSDHARPDTCSLQLPDCRSANTCCRERRAVGGASDDRGRAAQCSAAVATDQRGMNRNENLDRVDKVLITARHVCGALPKAVFSHTCTRSPTQQTRYLQRCFTVRLIDLISPTGEYSRQ